MTSEMLRGLAAWARAKGKKRPPDQAGMNALVAEYMAEMNAFAATHMATERPAWDEIPDRKSTHLAWDGVKSEIVDSAGPQDDFDQMMLDREDALVEGGGDDLTRDALLIEKEHAALHARAPFTRTNPVSILNGTLGGQVTLSNGDLPRTVAWWTGPDAETTPVTVTLGPVQQLNEITVPASITLSAARPYAIVQFGTRGFLVKAEVDIGTGCQFTISGSMVTVAVALPPLPSSSFQATSMVLSGMLSVKPIVRTAPITRTVYIDSLAQGGTISVDVPPFAKNVICFIASTTHGASLLFQTWSGTTQYTVTIAAGATMTVPVHLSGDVIIITYADTAGVGTVSASLIFELAL